MNYYKKVAEMFGVELNEEFSLKNNDDQVLSTKYKITARDGLMFKWDKSWYRSDRIVDIISGDLTVVKRPWNPKIGDKYYIYSIGCDEAVETTFTACTMDYLYWKTGNCFRNKEEAETKGYEIMRQIIEERNL